MSRERDENVAPKAAETGKGKVKDRIFDTASDLFYRQGIRCVGVESIASEAGTNKMSFYRSFASKDELVAEYLREKERLHWVWWDSIIAPYEGDPRRQVEALFEGYMEKAKRMDSCGCAFDNAAVELRESDHPALKVVRDFKAEIRKRMRGFAKQMGARDPAVLGDALTLLIDGGAMSRLLFDSKSGPFINVVAAVKLLIDSQLD